jgi:hypothetical protein
MQEYVAVREHPRRFVVLRGHFFLDVESVVATNDGYCGRGEGAEASEITAATNPNA